MSVDVGIDVGLLKSEIKKTYASVSQEPGKDFIFPTGRAAIRTSRSQPWAASRRRHWPTGCRRG